MKEIYINVESENDIYSTFGGPGDLNGEFVDNPQLHIRRLLVKHMNNNYTVIFKPVNSEQ